MLKNNNFSHTVIKNFYLLKKKTNRGPNFEPGAMPHVEGSMLRLIASK